MKAIVIARVGGPEVLELRDVPTPEPGPGQVRVRIVATAVNRADLLQRMGLYPPPNDASPDIPGLEFSGMVDALGLGANLFRSGDRVVGIAGGGTYAEYIVVHERTLSPTPRNLSFADAAAVPEAFLTAYDALVLQGRLAPGDRVLVHAAASGVGTAAVQVARAFGARTLGTLRSRAKADRLRAFGLEEVLVVKDGKFADAVRKATDGFGVDLVLDLVGGSYLPETLVVAAERARIVLVGLLGGREATIDLGTVLQKRICIYGTVLRSRPLEERIALAQTFTRQIAPLFEMGRLSPVVDREIDLSRASEAHALLASNETFGKIVLSVARQ